MIFPILSAKLHKPHLPDSMISKGVLLKDSQWASVILVSAQAGSGKSTAVSAWLSEQDRAYCWYSLDDWDNDLMQFFYYLAEGIKTIDGQAAEALKQLLDAYQTIGFEAYSRALIHQLHCVKSPFILILDDYHVIRNEQLHQVMRMLLEHLPPSMQLVLISREDPPFPLAKLRADKRLLEVRVSELKFTEDEANAFFSRQLQISLDPAQLRRLFQRTEGWIAGLQMAALSMQGLEDVNDFIEALIGSHYYVMDYLMEEVLEHHSSQIKAFLLQTSILESFSGDLCDALLQLDTGACSAMIERLVKTNSFIIPTDSSRQWYRYHHLFRDLLRQRLQGQPKSVLELLHRRAGLWLKANGREQEAIDHLLQANAFEEAAALIECKWAEMDSQLQSKSWLEVARRLPLVIIEKSPVLTMGYGWALLDMGDVETCTGWFGKALELYNRCQAGARPDDIIISDMAQFDMLPATVASAYAYIAAATGDIDGIFAHARYALTRIPKDQYSKRSVVDILLGFAHWESGDLKEAESVIAGSLNDIKRSSNTLIEYSYYMVLGELYIHQGSLSKAKAMFEQTIAKLIKEHLTPILLPSLYLGLAKIAFMQGDNGQSRALLEESKTYGRHYALMDWKYKHYLLLARIYCSEGLYDLARDCIHESRASYYLNPIPEDVTIDSIEKQIELGAAHQQPGQLPVPMNGKGQAFTKEHANQSLAEPLTARELEVLSLIVSGLSNQQICDTLFLALSTVKGYNQSIFGKLEVNRRMQAVAKAKELGLV